jgi:hypothetical protein
VIWNSECLFFTIEKTTNFHMTTLLRNLHKTKPLKNRQELFA